MEDEGEDWEEWRAEGMGLRGLEVGVKNLGFCRVRGIVLGESGIRVAELGEFG